LVWSKTKPMIESGGDPRYVRRENPGMVGGRDRKAEGKAR